MSSENSTEGTPVPSGTQDVSAPSTDVLTYLGVTPLRVSRSTAVGALAYAATWLVGLLSMLLMTAFTRIEDQSEEFSLWWLLTAPGQLVAMAFRSPASMSISASEEDFDFATTTSSTAPILIILLVAVVAVFRLSRRDERALPSGTTRGVVSCAAITAVTFAAIAWLLALVLKLSFSDDESKMSYGAASFQLILFATITLFLVGFFGRRPWHTWSSAVQLASAARGAWRAALTHCAVFGLLALVLAVIWLIAQDAASALLLLPVVVLNALVYAISLGHIGALNFSGGGSFAGEEGFGARSFWIFSDDIDKIAWLLLVFAIISAVAAAAVLSASGRDQVRTTSHAVWTVTVYAACGAALTFLGSVSTGVGASFGVDGSLSFGPAPWTLLVFAVWGGIVEILARLIGPTVSGLLPTTWISRAVGTQPTVHAPSGSDEVVSRNGGPNPTSGSTSVRASLSPKTVRIVVGIGGIAVLGVVAVIGVSIANGMFFGPDKQVKSYFAALSDGDADHALSLARLDYSKDERVLLTDEVLAKASAIDDVSVGDVEGSGNFATVTVDYTVDGAEQSQEVSLRKSGSRFGVFDKWVLVDPALGSLTVTAPGAVGFKVNGQDVRVGGLDDGISLPVFPGKYSIGPTGASTYLEFEPQNVSLGTDEESLDFEAVPTDKLKDDVAAQVGKFLTECISKKQADPDGCPNQTYGYELEDVKWTLDTSPTYSVVSDFAGSLRFETTTPGSASVTAKEPSFLDDEPAEDYTDEVAIELSGEVTLSGQTVTVQVDDYF